MYRDDYIYITAGYEKGGVQYRLSADGTKISKKWEDATLDVRHGGVLMAYGIKNKHLHSQTPYFPVYTIKCYNSFFAFVNEMQIEMALKTNFFDLLRLFATILA